MLEGNEPLIAAPLELVVIGANGVLIILRFVGDANGEANIPKAIGVMNREWPIQGFIEVQDRELNIQGFIGVMNRGFIIPKFVCGTWKGDRTNIGCMKPALGIGRNPPPIIIIGRASLLLGRPKTPKKESIEAKRNNNERDMNPSFAGGGPFERGELKMK
jgi:hypothetical protein